MENEMRVKDHLVEGANAFSMLMQKLTIRVVISLALLFVVFLAQAQQEINVKGKILDESGHPVPSVSIFEKGTTHGTIADIDGNYTLTLTSESPVLVFSFIGMKTKEVEVGSRTLIDVTMESDAIGLNEVIAVGYGTQKKVNLTGSVATVQSEELIKVPSSSVSNLLTGKAPGLFVKQAQGVPGADVADISIRGFDAPLVLVDGVESSWNRMDPNEIESISVLKDAAAAIYGARAGNGVILITTKRGSNNKPTITYAGNYTIQQPTTVPEFVPSWQYAELLREGQLNNQLNYTYSEEDVQKFKDGNDPNYVNENWYDAAFRPWSPMQTHNLGVRGGSDDVKYYMSVGYMDQGGMYRSGDINFNRYNARSNIDAQVTDRLSVSLDLSIRNELSESPTPVGTSTINESIIGTWNSLKTALPMWPAHLPDPDKGGAYSGAQVRSPVAQTQSKFAGSLANNTRYIFGRLSLNYEIPKVDGLEANATFSYTGNENFEQRHTKQFEVFSYDYNSEEYTSRGMNGSNTLYKQTSRYTQIYPMISLRYDKTFGAHDVNGLLLAEGIDTEYTFLSANRFDLLSPEIPYLFAGSVENQNNNSGATETGRMSYVGRGNYAYKGKYLVEATFRYDASHRFPEETRWGFFPSASAAWRISEESFLKDNAFWLDNLKLRASYSQAGSDNVSAFRYLTGYSILPGPAAVYVFGSDAYRRIQSTGLPNPSITWLDMTNYNVGLDASFWNGKLGVEFDYFFRITENIFGQPLDAYPSTFGSQLPELNINSTDNRGFELTLTHRNNVSRDLSYSVSASGSYAREKYRDWSEPVYEDEDEIRIFKNTGNYTNRWIGYKSDGLFMSQEDIDNHAIDQDGAGNSTLRPGDIKYVDLNDDNVIDWRDQQEIGYGTFPNITYGINLQVEYKGFGVSALFQGASMFNTMINDVFRSPFQNDSNPFGFHYKHRWQPDPENPGVNINPDAQLPAILADGSGSNPNNRMVSDFWLKDATYLRLRDLNVSYTIPSRLTQQVGIQKVNVYVAGSNLFTISKLGIYKDSLDPENTGAQKFYPPMKTVSFGINLTL